LAVTLNAAGARTVTASDITDTNKTANTSASIAVSAAGFVNCNCSSGETAAPGTASGKTGAPLPQTAGTAQRHRQRGGRQTGTWSAPSPTRSSIGSSDPNDVCPAIPRWYRHEDVEA